MVAERKVVAQRAAAARGLVMVKVEALAAKGVAAGQGAS